MKREETTMNKPLATPVPDNVLAAASEEAATETSQRRDLIKTAVDAAANGVMENIKSLRGQLDELENLVLQNAARVSDNLNTHVSICESAQIEVKRLTGIVAGMRKTQVDDGNEKNGQRH